MYKKILVAFDGSEMASNALYQAAQLAKATNSEKVTIVHAIIHSPIVREYTTLDIELFLEKENKEILTKAIDYLNSENVPYEVETLHGNEAGQVIADYAIENEYDLIVMGQTGKGMVKEAMFGSVSRTVLRLVKCSVLITR